MIDWDQPELPGILETPGEYLRLDLEEPYCGPPHGIREVLYAHVEDEDELRLDVLDGICESTPHRIEARRHGEVLRSASTEPARVVHLRAVTRLLRIVDDEADGATGTIGRD